MKALLFILLAFALLLLPAGAQDAAPPPPDGSTPPNPASPGADPIVPTADFSAARYEVLWTKSPFSVATPEGGDANSSPDYILVGIARVDGISYGSVIERQSGQHFLISSDKATRGLRLTNITKSADGTSTYASVMKDGELLTLQLQQAPAAGQPPGGAPMNIPGAPGTPPQTAPGTIVPNIQMPGAFPGFNGGVRPFPRIHRPLIHLPQPPPQPGQP